MRLVFGCRQRDERERPVPRQKLRREILVRAVMRDKHGQRRLRVAPCADRNVGGVPGDRAPAIRCDDQRRFDRLSRREPGAHDVAVWRGKVFPNVFPRTALFGPYGIDQLRDPRR